MKKFFLGVAWLLGVTATAQFQDQKNVEAIRVERSPHIDGVIDEDVWNMAPIATGFSELDPNNGITAPNEFRTEFQIAYDNSALYFAVKLYDEKPDSVLREFGARDSEGKNADWVAFWINPYADGQNDINFVLSAAGVQTDSRTTINGDDVAWNAVWQSAVQITDFGWTCEVKIPFYNLRIPESDIDWGLNVGRYVRRTRTTYTWNFIDRSFGTYEQQNGRITGIKEIDTPVRLSLMPYVSGYLNNYDGNFSTDYNAGLDLKYGINNAFTLDMTLIPDFGQARFDNQVLNLSPFEVRFQENRQFFTEGTELFSKGDLFYSRRVGGFTYDSNAPREIADSTGETIISNPRQAQVINATKVSGRNDQNLGIGIFNGISIDTYAVLEDSSGNQREVLTDPFSNYNMIVLDQLYGQNNYVTLVNTNVMRRGKEFHNANVTGLLARHQTKNSAVILDASLKSSQLFYEDSTSLGFASEFSASRGRGNLRWIFRHYMTTDTYDPNDLGFLTRNNELNHMGGLNYRTFESGSWYNSLRGDISIYYGMLQSPNAFRYFGTEGSGRITFINFFTVGGNFDIDLKDQHDYFEPREAGRFLIRPTRTYGELWLSTDYRKTFAFDLRVNRGFYSGFGSDDYGVVASPRLRVNNHLSFIYRLEQSWNINNVGWVNQEDNGDIIMGKRDRNTTINQLTADYVFDENTSVNLIFRHYWSTADYNDYGILMDDGTMNWLGDYPDNYDVNFNAWNIDLTFTWWFAPGSQMTLLYRQAILASNDNPDLDFSENLNSLFSRPQQNNLSLRVIYWLDYNSLRKHHHKI